MSTFWEPLPPPPEVKAALDEFTAWGAVAQHYLFAAPAVVDSAAHAMAAKSGLNAELQRVTEIIEIIQKSAPLGSPQVDWSKIRVRRASQWTPQQFFGPSFDVEIAKPLFVGGRTFGLFPVGSEQTPENNRQNVDLEYFGGYSNFSARGYAYAVLYPPYSLQRSEESDIKVGSLKNEELSRSFVALCDAIFGEVSNLQIWSWPVSCSDYFTPGLDWWGSYFWTVYAPSKNWIVTIFASSTD